MSEERDRFLATFVGAARAAGLVDAEVRTLIGPLSKTQAVDAGVSHRRGAMLLLGPPGTGKTLGASRWMIAPLLDLANWEHDGSTWFPRGTISMLWRTAKSLSRVKQYEPRELEQLFSARRMVLDDLGQEYLDKSGFLASLLDEIVTERHRRDLPTAMTANLNVEEFEARYGRRVLDRVAGAGKVVVCAGTSLRRGAAGRATIQPLFTQAAITSRVAACRDRRAREARELHEAWAAEEARRGTSPPAPKPVPRMEGAALAARKAEIAAQVAAYAAKEGG